MSIKNQIRNGNFVLDYNGRMCQVKSFTNDEIVLTLEDRDYYITRFVGQSVEEFYEKITKAPLTEELLLNFGFVPYNDDENEMIEWSKDGFTLYQENWSEEFKKEEFDFATRTKNGTFKSGFRVSSAHHLQNLYFYTQNFKELSIIKYVLKDE